jgi:hypothetical protein
MPTSGTDNRGVLAGMALRKRVKVGQSVLALALLAIAGCSSNPEPPPPSIETLVELGDWREVPRERDPFVTELDAAPACDGPAFTLEEQWLEIDTGLCNWVTLVAPARVVVEIGEQLRFAVSHFDLEAPEPAEAELRLSLALCDTWSKHVPIPSAAAVYSEPFESPCAITVGADVYVHLHNHGQNNWQLQELSVQH